MSKEKRLSKAIHNTSVYMNSHPYKLRALAFGGKVRDVHVKGHPRNVVRR